MVPLDPHEHDHGHAHPHGHGHHHGATSPHPAQAAAWSIMRMPVASRLLVATAVSACLWAIVWLAAR
jgi:hypothetical protein